MKGMKGLAAGVGVAVLMVVVAACGSGESSTTKDKSAPSTSPSTATTPGPCQTTLALGDLRGVYRTEGASMEPNFHSGQLVTIERILASELRRADVIVFHFPLDPRRTGPQGCARNFMKRIVGLPSDRIEISKGVVLIDGIELVEPYDPNKDSSSLKHVVLGMDEFFVLGDNRDRSNDSRNWGPLPADAIVAKVVAASGHSRGGWVPQIMV